MPEFRHGFKAWCERAASGFRRDLGLHPYAKLCPRELAAHLKIKVIAPADIPGIPRRALEQLIDVDWKGWSAVTIIRSGRKLIVLNSACSVVRQISSLMHEIAHIVLDHEPARVDVSTSGLMLLQTYDPTQEKEADWLSAALLVPRDALLSYVRCGKTTDQAAEYFGVSLELARMRRNTTGIDRQLFAS